MVALPHSMKGILLHKPGQAVKAVPRGNGLVEGYLLAYGNPQDSDLEGQWFTPNTDLRLDWFSERPVLYHHGLDQVVGLDPVGRVKSLQQDDIGLWVQAQLHLADRYGREVHDMVQTGQFGWSSGSIDHLVQIAPSGEILTWPVFEGSVTPTPAQPHKTTVRALKSILGDHPLFEDLRELEAGAGDEAARVKTLYSGVSIMNPRASTKRFVRATLKAQGYKATEDEIETIASELEEDEAALNDDEMFLADDELDVMSDFEDDSMLNDDEMFLADDELDVMSDFEDDSMLDDDEFNTMMSDFEDDSMLDDDEMFLSDEEEIAPTLSRRRKSRRRAKSYSGGHYVQSDQSGYIQRLERRIKALERMEAPGEGWIGLKAISGVRDVADRKGAYKATFMNYLRRGELGLSPTERYVLQSRQVRYDDTPDSVHGPIKALNTSNAGSVGFGVPEDFVAELNRNVMVDAVTAAECKTRTTSSDTLLQPDLPTNDARRAFPGTARWPGEQPANQGESQITDIGLGQIQLPVHVMLVSTTATYTSLEDVAFDLQATISEQFAEIIAVEYETLIWNGNGQGKMRGIVNDARVTANPSVGIQTVGGYVPSGAANKITSGDPLKKMMMNLPPHYRRRAKWVGNSNTLLEIFKLKDGEGRFLWGDAQGLNQGEPTTLLGKPIVYNEYADDIGAGNFPLLFADLSRGYLIAKRVEFSVRRFDDALYAVQDSALFLGRARIGGQVVQPAAFKALKIAAA